MTETANLLSIARSDCLVGSFWIGWVPGAGDAVKGTVRVARDGAEQAVAIGGTIVLKKVDDFKGSAAKARPSPSNDRISSSQQIKDNDADFRDSQKPLIQSNKEAGQDGENFLARTYGGQQQANKGTSLGRRVIDNLVNGIGQ